MAELYNNLLNIEKGGWAGTRQDSQYGDGYKTKADRAAGLNYHVEDDRVLQYIIDENTGKKRYKKHFAHFDHWGSGLRAAFRLLRGKGYLKNPDLRVGKTMNGKLNLRAIIMRFAPPKDANNVDAYIDNVTEVIREHRDKKFDPENIKAEDIPNLIFGKLFHENGHTTFVDEEGKTHKFRDYYLPESEENKRIWEIASWAAQKSYDEEVSWNDIVKEYDAGLKLKDKTAGLPYDRGTGVDDAGPVGQEARRDKSKKDDGIDTYLAEYDKQYGRYAQGG